MRFWQWWWWWGAVGGSLLTNHHTLVTCGASHKRVSKSFRTPCIEKCGRQEKTDLGLFLWLLLMGLRPDLRLLGCAALPAAWQSPLGAHWGPGSSAKTNSWTCFSQLLPDAFWAVRGAAAPLLRSSWGLTAMDAHQDGPGLLDASPFAG